MRPTGYRTSDDREDLADTHKFGGVQDWMKLDSRDGIRQVSALITSVSVIATLTREKLKKPYRRLRELAPSPDSAASTLTFLYYERTQTSLKATLQALHHAL